MLKVRRIGKLSCAQRTGAARTGRTLYWGLIGLTAAALAGYNVSLHRVLEIPAPSPIAEPEQKPQLPSDAETARQYLQTALHNKVPIPDRDILLPIYLGMIEEESNFDPRAISKTGAAGLMQLQVPNATEQGLTVYTPEEFFVPRGKGLTFREEGVDFRKQYGTALKQWAKGKSLEELAQSDERFDPVQNVGCGLHYHLAMFSRFQQSGYDTRTSADLATIGFNVGHTATGWYVDNYRPEDADALIRTLRRNGTHYEAFGQSKSLPRGKLNEAENYLHKIRRNTAKYEGM